MLYLLARHTSATEQATRVLGSFRRVSFVRIDRGAGRAVVVGVRHRLPVEVAVPIEVAEAMRARGIPATVHAIAS